MNVVIEDKINYFNVEGGWIVQINGWYYVVVKIDGKYSLDHIFGSYYIGKRNMAKDEFIKTLKENQAAVFSPSLFELVIRKRKTT